jgi:hypothetical protein
VAPTARQIYVRSGEQSGHAAPAVFKPAPDA